ncbi:MAG: hypothetical protein IRY99_02530 [Isosphaeraceae bacterium]|nr:hypothetical protein [Isosphaeraceae bacterium]
MKRPYLELKDGMVKATIWHEIRDGQKHFNIAFSRLFKDNDRWWDGAYFQRQDIPALCRLANDADLWIRQQRQLESVAEDENETEGAS